MDHLQVNAKDWVRPDVTDSMLAAFIALTILCFLCFFIVQGGLNRFFLAALTTMFTFYTAIIAMAVYG